MNSKIFHIISVVNFLLLIGLIFLGRNLIDSPKERSSDSVRVIYSSDSISGDTNLLEEKIEGEGEKMVDLVNFLNEQDKEKNNLIGGFKEGEPMKLPDSFSISYGGIVTSLYSKVPLTGYDSESGVSVSFDIEIHGERITHLQSSIASQGKKEVEQAFEKFQEMLPEIIVTSTTEIVSSQENNIIFIEFKNILGEYLNNNQ